MRRIGHIEYRVKQKRESGGVGWGGLCISEKSEMADTGGWIAKGFLKFRECGSCVVLELREKLGGIGADIAIGVRKRAAKLFDILGTA